jgi:hypothetical protein
MNALELLQDLQTRDIHLERAGDKLRVDAPKGMLTPEVRIPSKFILEEAVSWLPQNLKESPFYGSETLTRLQGVFFNDMVRKGRKLGLEIMVVCQKIAEIDKRALQSDAKILHYQSERPDLELYAKMGIPQGETLSLQPGDAFLFSSSVSKKRVHVRKRHSPHGANTPGLENLQRYQRTRNLVESDAETWRNSAISAHTRNTFDEPLEPFRIERPCFTEGFLFLCSHRNTATREKVSKNHEDIRSAYDGRAYRPS